MVGVGTVGLGVGSGSSVGVTVGDGVGVGAVGLGAVSVSVGSGSLGGSVGPAAQVLVAVQTISSPKSITAVPVSGSHDCPPLQDQDSSYPSGPSSRKTYSPGGRGTSVTSGSPLAPAMAASSGPRAMRTKSSAAALPPPVLSTSFTSVRVGMTAVFTTEPCTSEEGGMLTTPASVTSAPVQVNPSST